MRVTTKAAMVFTALFGLTLPGWSQPVTTSSVRQPVPGEKSWFEATEPLHIVGPINYVGTKGLGVYLITTPAGDILLGGGMPPSASLIKDSILKLGHKPEEIKILLSNHAHVDHVGTLAELKKWTGASVAVMDRDVELLASGGKLDYLFGTSRLFRFPPVKTDRVLHDGDNVELGGVKLTAHLTAGHTPGCTTFVTTVEDGGTSYVVVFVDGTSINTGTRFINNPSYPGILEDFRGTFSTLESLKPDIFLAYHEEHFGFADKRARAATEGVRAFVDPDGYRRFVSEKKAKLEEMVAQEKAANARETSVSQAQPVDQLKK